MLTFEILPEKVAEPGARTGRALLLIQFAFLIIAITSSGDL
jgi:hypothetical protein